MSTTKPLSEFYFVPLGRERGGFLDILGLPPDASNEQVKTAEKEFRRQIKLDAVEQRKKWKQQLEEKLITQEEFDAKLEEIEAEKNRRETDLNELNLKFEKVQSDRRKLANEGRKDFTAGWIDAFQQFDDAPAFWQFLKRVRPLPQRSAEYLDSLSQRWITSVAGRSIAPADELEGVAADAAADLDQLTLEELKHREEWLKHFLQTLVEKRQRDLNALLQAGAMDKPTAKAALQLCKDHARQAFANFVQQAKQSIARSKKSAGRQTSATAQNFPHQAVADGSALTLNTVCGLIQQQETLALLLADSLWSELQGTMRSHWRDEMARHAAEVSCLGPDLLPDRSPATTSDDYFCVCLANEPSGVIERLEASDGADLPQQPLRESSAQLPAEDLARLLEMLRRASAPAPGAASPEAAAGNGYHGSEQVSVDELLRLFEAFHQQPTAH